MNGGGGYVSPGVNIEPAVNMDVEEETCKTQPEQQPWKTNAAPVVPAATAPEIEDEEVFCSTASYLKYLKKVSV